MGRCASNKDVILTFAKIEIYIVILMVMILVVLYIVHIVPIYFDVARMLILALLVFMVMYIWYNVTIRITDLG